MEASEFQQIRHLLDDYLRMYSSRDDQLTGQFSDDFSGFTGGGQSLIQSRVEWVAITRQDFAQVPEPIRIDLKDLAIQPLADSVAVATAFYHIHLPMKDHILSRETARLVLVFHRQPGGWKIAHSSISIPYHLVREGEVYPLEGLEERNHFLEEQIAERTRQLSEANADLQRTNAKLEAEIRGHMATEVALRASEERFRQLAEIFPETIFEADTAGRLTYANEHGQQKFGLTPADFDQGYSLAEGVVTADRPLVRHRTRERLAGLTGGFMEYQAQCLNGSTFEAMAYSAPIIQEGIAVGLRGFILDVSDAKRAEREKAKLMAQLQRAQKMDGLGILAGGVAHDMNNVLGAILGMASAHQQLQPEGSPAHRAFDIIAKAATRGGKMVQSLLNFARQSPSEMRAVDLNELLQEQVHFLERTTLSRIRIELDPAPDLHPILGDPNTLTHMVMNIFFNAIEAMEAGGVLSIQTRNGDRDTVEVLVEDTGTGMAKEVLDRAMDPFFTTKAQGKGTGLGLAMVYKTVHSHQGTIEISSEPARGTQVRLCFPATRPATPAVAAAPEPARSRLEVLLVDDDDLVQSSMQEILAMLGHQVTAAYSGEEALVSLEGICLPDVVILDLNMPGLGGAATLRQLRRIHPEIPILLATGRADQTALDLVDAFPGVILLSKPFSLEELKHNLGSLGPGER